MSRPGDRFEQEADRTAEAVASRNAGSWVKGSSGLSPGHRIPVSSSLGKPLPQPMRADMEARFGADFGAVRLHMDRQDVEQAQALQARAFTIGREIWLGAGERPENVRLLAHELTHVLQQTAGRQQVSSPLVIQRTPFSGETPEQEARRRAMIDAAHTARARLVEALARGRLWPAESEAADGVSSRVTGGTETYADREARLRRIIQDLIALVRHLESGPVPEAWFEPELSEPSGSLSIGSVTQPEWQDTVAAYANRAQTAGMSLDEIYINIPYINTDPLPERRIAPARIQPRGINIGVWIVVPDPENAPLTYYRLTGFERVRGTIMDVWQDDFGYFYRYKGRRHYLPGRP